MHRALVLAFLALSACTPDPSTVYGDCPCPSGFICCPGENRCVLAGGSCSVAPPIRDMAQPGHDLEHQAPDLLPPPSSTPDLAPAPPFSFQPATLTFGNVYLANQPIMSVTVVNSQAERITNVELGGSNSDEIAIVADTCTDNLSTTCALNIAFQPTRAGAVAATITLDSWLGSTSSFTITGTGVVGTPQLAVSPTTLDFGDVHVGTQSGSAMLAVTNNGTAATTNLHVSFAPPSGPFALDGAGHGDGCGPVLAVGASCIFYVAFLPQKEAPLSGSVTVADGTSNATTVALTGNGVNPGALQILPADAVPSTWLSQTSDVTFHVSNSGGDPTGAIASAISGVDAGDYSLVSDGCAGQALAAGADCDITVRFTPLARGVRPALLKVSATPGGSTSAILDGSGLEPGVLKLDSGNGTVVTDNPSFATITFQIGIDGDGSVGPLSASLAGTSGGVFAIAPGNLDCQGAVMLPQNNQVCFITVTFAPIFQRHATDTLTIDAPGSTLPFTPLVIPLDGTFTSKDTLRATPNPMKFGSVNRAGWDSVSILNVTSQPIGPLTLALSGDSNFSIFDGSACQGQTLAAGGRCVIKVEYTPTFTGTFTGQLGVTAPTGSVVVALSASSTLAALKFDPATVDFGTVAIGTVPPVTVTVTNVSNRPATTAYTVSSASFWATSGCPATLLPAPATPNSCTITVGFGPQSAGTFNGAVKFTVDVSSTLPLVGIAQ